MSSRVDRLAVQNMDQLALQGQGQSGDDSTAITSEGAHQASLDSEVEVIESDPDLGILSNDEQIESVEQDASGRVFIRFAEVTDTQEIAAAPADARQVDGLDNERGSSDDADK